MPRFILVIVLCAVSISAQCSVICVKPTGDDANTGLGWDNAKKTVTAGLAVAVSGDQVWVAAGIYIGNYTLGVGTQLYGGFAGNETSLEQRDAKVNLTVLDTNTDGSLMTIAPGASTSTVVDGFVLTRGKSTGTYSSGRAFYCKDASPTISGNVIAKNSGIYCEASSAVISGNTINDSGDAGAIYCKSGTPIITDNVISRSVAKQSLGAIVCMPSSSPVISRNHIYDTLAKDWSFEESGSGIYCLSSSAKILNNIIRRSTYNGICCKDSSPLVAGNVIYGNTVGILCMNSNARIINNTISANYKGISFSYTDSTARVANNICTDNAYGLYSKATDNSAQPVVVNNCVHNNRVANYFNIPDATGISGNISVDPKFALRPYGDLHIQPDSPCVDAGNAANIDVTWKDLDDDERVVGLAADIGADESDGTLWNVSPSIVRVAPEGDDSNDGLSWATAKRTLQAAVSTAVSGLEVWVKEGTYAGTIELPAFVHLFGGFDSTETEREQRNWRDHVSMIKGASGYTSAVSVAAGEGVSSLDGFTLTDAIYGVYCKNSSPVIKNNTFTGNRLSMLNGGAVHCVLDASPLITNNIIRNCTTGGNGIINCELSSPVVINNVFQANKGPVIRCETGSVPVITNNTFVSNAGSSVIYCNKTSPVIENNIIAYNTAGVRNIDGSPVLRGNCVFDNSLYNYSGTPDPTGSIGNKSEDPQFASLGYGDFHIQPGSPCLDAGVNTTALPVENDVDGENRIFNGRIDIGADESTGTTWQLPVPRVVYVGTAGDDANDGSSWATAKRSIQAGIDEAATTGGEVWVAAGVYQERITVPSYVYMYGGFSGIESDIDQRNISTNETILDGQQLGVVVNVTVPGHRVNRLDGFTICNGKDTNTSGGVFCNGASLVIANNKIVTNSGRLGGGIGSQDSYPLIKSNTISHNTAEYGGGIFCDNADIVDNIIDNNAATAGDGGGVVCSNGIIKGNKVTHNSASGSSSGYYICGGGIFGRESGYLTIIENVITDNKAKYGGGVACKCNAEILDNTIYNNSATGDGGGVFCMTGNHKIAENTVHYNVCGTGRGGGIYLSSASAVVLSNSIKGNSAYYSYGSTTGGGGIYCSTPNAMIANCEIAGNTCEGDGGGVLCLAQGISSVNNTITNNLAKIGAGGIHSSYYSATIANTIVAYNSSGITGTTSGMILSHNNVYGNTMNQYSGCTDPTGSAGNIRVDPKLVNRAFGNNHIQSDSPCINAGDDSYVAVGWLDVDGQERVQSGRVDIGADESDGTSWDIHPRVVRVDPDGDDENDGSSWEVAMRTIAGGISEAQETGAEVWVKAGQYYELITIPSYVYLYGGFAGTESTKTERDWSASSTIIDGNESGPVVSFKPGYRLSALDGFTVTNGKAYSSAGIRIPSGASPTLANNRVIGNIATGAGMSGNGGGISCGTSDLLMYNSVIAGNSANRGGGIYYEGGSGIFANNTIVSNNAVEGGAYAGSGGSFTNCIVAFNSNGFLRYGGNYTPSLKNSCFYGNSGYAFSAMTDPGNTNGNILVDPKFVSVDYRDYRIQPDSPCVNSGTISVNYGQYDISHQPRVQELTIDMGAYESDGSSYPEPVHTIVRVSVDGDDQNDGSSWASSKRTIQAAINAIPAAGEIWVKSGEYQENIELRPYVYLYGGFGGVETKRDERDWRQHVSVIDGQQLGSVVTSEQGGYLLATLDGFTVRNGKADKGGGIFCNNTSTLFINNTVTGNTANTKGGGIYLNQSSGTLMNNVMSGNQGTGIYLEYGFPLVEGNLISENSAVDGGGIVSAYSSSRIERNAVSDNVATRYGGGIALFGAERVKLASNIITRNSAGSHGGAVMVSGGVSTTTINNNTVVDNTQAGDGAVFLNNTSAYLANNIVAFNSSGIYKSGTNTPKLWNNNIYNPDGYDYSGLAAGTGDISAAPMFVDYASGDYHLTVNSSCINAGWNEASNLPATDFDEDARVWGKSVDIGADELTVGLPPMTASDVKLPPDGAVVNIMSGIVTAVFSDCLYIEATDRSCGVRVEVDGHTATVGSLVEVIGVVRTNANGERYIAATEIIHTINASTPGPVGVTNLALGGGKFGYQDGVWNWKWVKYSWGMVKTMVKSPDLNNMGLLVRTSGKFSYVDESSFTIDDGSGVIVKCVIPPGVTLNQGWQYVGVTGVSSCEMANGRLQRLLRVRWQDDITIIQ